MIDFTTLVSSADQLPIQSLDWGTLQWLCNSELLPGTMQTVGICHLHAGKCNPLHYHPNCEEILYVVQGEGKHLLYDQWIPVRPGSIVRIPVGVPHKLVNESEVVMTTFIVFSSPDRHTVFLE